MGELLTTYGDGIYTVSLWGQVGSQAAMLGQWESGPICSEASAGETHGVPSALLSIGSESNGCEAWVMHKTRSHIPSLIDAIQATGLGTVRYTIQAQRLNVQSYTTFKEQSWNGGMKQAFVHLNRYLPAEDAPEA